MTILQEKESSYAKNEYNLFCQKKDTKYFHVKIIFSEKAIFSEETAKNCSGDVFDHFLGKGGFLGKNLIKPSLSRIR